MMKELSKKKQMREAEANAEARDEANAEARDEANAVKSEGGGG